MFQLRSAEDNRVLHFINLSRYERDGYPAHLMVGKYWEIDKAIYEEFENLLPPIYCTGGFRLCERLTGDIAATFFKIGTRYWCGYTDLDVTRPEKLLRVIRRKHHQCA